MPLFLVLATFSLALGSLANLVLHTLGGKDSLVAMRSVPCDSLLHRTLILSCKLPDNH